MGTVASVGQHLEPLDDVNTEEDADSVVAVLDQAFRVFLVER